MAGLGAQAAAAATVAQLLGYVVGIISRINQKANTARQNKSECLHLAHCVSVIGDLLHHLQRQDPEAARVLAGLGDTLREAHALIVACCSQRKRDALRGFFGANGHAERFREVNGRIDSHLAVVPLLSLVTMTDNLKKNVQTGVPKSSSAPSRASGSHSCQLQVGASSSPIRKYKSFEHKLKRSSRWYFDGSFLYKHIACLTSNLIIVH